MKKSIIILCIFLNFSFIVFGQGSSINLNLTDCRIDKNNLILNLSFLNISQKKIAIYLPQKKDVCCGIVKFEIVELKNSKEHEYRPYNVNASLDHIILDSCNSVYLYPSELYSQKIRLSKTKIFPYLKKNRYYKIKVKLYFEGVDFKSRLNNIFRENIESNEVVFKGI